MEDLLKEFIENNIDLIDDNNWDKLFKLCPIGYMTELRKMLKEADVVDFKVSNSTQNVMAHSSIVAEIKKFLKSHNIDYSIIHNDKGKNGRTLKFVRLSNVPANIDRLLAEYLDNIGVEYDYINYSKDGWYNRGITNILRVRLTPEA